MPQIKKVPVDNVRAVFDQAAETIKGATKNNVVVSNAELSKTLDKVEDKRERALIKMLYNYAGHLDADHLTTKKDVDNAIANNLDRLVNGRDRNNDGKIGSFEARSLSKMGKIAYGIAKSRIDAPVEPGPPEFGEMLDRAIASGAVKLDMQGNNIVGVKVEENYGDGGLAGEPELLGMVLDLPQAKNIQQVSVGYIEEWAETDTYEEAIAVIADRGPLPGLKNLFVGDFHQDQTEISWVDLGAVDALLKAAPNMTEMTLRGGGIEIGKLEHDKLQKLTIETGGLPGDSMAAIGKAKLPQLKELEVWFGSSEYGFEGDIQNLRGLLGGQDFGALKRLGLQNAEFTDDVVPMVLNSRLLGQLDSLDLSMGTLSDAGAQALIDNKNKLAHLKTLNVDDNFVSDGMIAKLQGAFGDRVTAKNQKEDWDEQKYVSVGE